MKTKMIIVMFCIGALVTQEARAQGGGMGGNGGGAWVCSNRDHLHTIRWAKLVDIYEATNERYPELKKISGLDMKLMEFSSQATEQEITDKVMIGRLFMANPEVYRGVNEELIKVNGMLTPTDSRLRIIDDALYDIEPHPSECPNGDIDYVQLANYKPNGIVLYQRGLYEDPHIGEYGRSNLKVHEAVYAYLRRPKYADSNSVRARKFVALLYSTLAIQDLSKQIALLLGSTPGPKPSTEPDYFPTHLFGSKPSEGASKLRALFNHSDGRAPSVDELTGKFIGSCVTNELGGKYFQDYFGFARMDTREVIVLTASTCTDHWAVTPCSKKYSISNAEAAFKRAGKTWSYTHAITLEGEPTHYRFRLNVGNNIQNHFAARVDDTHPVDAFRFDITHPENENAGFSSDYSTFTDTSFFRVQKIGGIEKLVVFMTSKGKLRYYGNFNGSAYCVLNVVNSKSNQGKNF